VAKIKINMRPAIRRTAYGCYIFSATVLFLYVLFPSEALKGYLAHRLSGGNQNVAVFIDRVRPVLPPGLKLAGVRYEHEGQTWFVFKQLTVNPALFSLMKGDGAYAFEARAYDGRIEGDVGPVAADSGRPPALKARLTDIRIEQIPALSALLPKKVTGRLSGTLSRNAEGGLAASLRLLEGTVQLDAPLIGLDTIGFQNIDAEIELNGQTVTVKKGTLVGADLDAAVSGTIRTGPRMEEATLNLRGTVSPHNSFLAKLEQRLPANVLRGKDKIGFRLTGPIGSPGIAFE